MALVDRFVNPVEGLIELSVDQIKNGDATDVPYIVPSPRVFNNSSVRAIAPLTSRSIW